MPGGSRARLALDGELDGQPARPQAGDQVVEPAEARLRRELERVVVVRSISSSRRISVSACSPARSIASSASRVSGAPGRELAPPAARLQHHHADRVGDHVVQLPGDPGALLLDRGLRALESRPARAGGG